MEGNCWGWDMYKLPLILWQKGAKIKRMFRSQLIVIFSPFPAILFMTYTQDLSLSFFYKVELFSLLLEGFLAYLILRSIRANGRKVTLEILEPAIIDSTVTLSNYLSERKDSEEKFSSYYEDIANKTNNETSIAYFKLSNTYPMMIHNWFIAILDLLLIPMIYMFFQFYSIIWKYSFIFLIIPIAFGIRVYLESIRRRIVYQAENNVFKKSFAFSFYTIEIFSKTFPNGLEGKLLEIGDNLVLEYSKNNKRFLIKVTWNDLTAFSVSKMDNKEEIEMMSTAIGKLVESQKVIQSVAQLGN